MIKITGIECMGSESGEAGCTNGKYDVEYVVSFDDGTQGTVYSCRCGNGCNGSFPINRVKIGMEFVNWTHFREIERMDDYSDEEWEAMDWEKAERYEKERFA